MIFQIFLFGKFEQNKRFATSRIRIKLAVSYQKNRYRAADRGYTQHHKHSYGSLFVNEGINIQEIARRLRLSDVIMPWNTYSHLYPRDEECAVNVLNKINVYEMCTRNKKAANSSGFLMFA